MANIFTGGSTTAIWDFLLGASGATYCVNGADRPQVQDNYASATRNMGIVAPAAAVTFDADSGTGLTGDYYYYAVWYNANSDTRSSPSPISAVKTVANKTINVNRPEAPPETQITHWRLYRNTAGQAETFYKVADIAATTTDYADDESDDTISLNEVMDEDSSRPDPQHPFIGFHNGRFFLYGGRTESTGTIAVTNSNATITGTGTEFKAGHVGQRIVINDEAVIYTIATVASTTSATITPVYAGTTNGSRTFKIRPFFPAKFQWSRATHYEEFPLAQAGQAGAFDMDPTTTGMFTVMDALYFAKEKHLYRMSFTSNPDPVDGDGQVFHVSDGRGLLNDRCVIVRGNSAYILDRQGFYRFDGSQETGPIDLAVSPLVIPSHIASTLRINWAQSNKFHGVWEPKRKRCMWFVAVGTDTEPKTALCYEPERQRWSTETYRNGITASRNQADGNGVERAWVFDEYGLLWALTTNQGADGSLVTTTRGTVTSSGATSLTDSGATFSTGSPFRDYPIGSWVHVYSGTGIGQYRRITAAASATQLTITPAWSVNPAAGDLYRIGDVEMTLMTQIFQMDPIPPGETKKARYVKIGFAPTTASCWMGLTVYKDYSTSPYLEWDLSEEIDGLQIPSTARTDGEVKIYFDTASGIVTFPLDLFAKAYQFKLRYEEVNRPIPLTSFEIAGATEPRGDWRDQ